MKKILFALVLSLAAIDRYAQMGFGFGMGMHIPLNGNNGAQRSRNIENHVQQMKTDLNLSDDQTI